MGVLCSIAEVASTLVENGIIILFLFCYFQPKKKGVTAYVNATVAFVVLNAFILVLNNYYYFENYLALISVGICVLYSRLCLKGRLISQVLAMLLIASGIFLINMTVNLVCSVIFEVTSQDLLNSRDMLRVFSLMVTKLIFAAIALIILNALRKKKMFVRRRDAFILAAICFSMLVSGVYIIRARLENSIVENYDFIVFTVLVCYLFVILVTYLLINRLSREYAEKNRMDMIELQLEEKKHEIQRINESYYEMQKTRHDMKNWLICATQLLDEGKTESAAEYLESISREKLTANMITVRTDNDFLNAILSNKLSKCKAEGIECDCKIAGTVTGFDNIDLCVLVANLLDNAIEASEKVRKPYVEIQMFDQRGYMKLTVINKIDKSVLSDNKRLKTTKENSKNHGFGLHSVRDICDKYDGMTDIYEKDDKFIAECWLKLQNNGI